MPAGIRRALPALCAACCVAGCQLPDRAADRAAAISRMPILERFRAFYPDAREGRIISLADFEAPEQAAMFRTTGPDGEEGDRAQPVLSVRRARDETGAGSLKARFERAGDELRFDGRRSTQYALRRDWRAYPLLMMSLHAPDSGAQLVLVIRDGAAAARGWSQRLTLRAGWNLIRIDTATVGEFVDLSDVRSITWKPVSVTEPLDLYVDDVLLVDNTETIVPATDAAGELYVLKRGRRIVVGAPGRFELAFANGVIVGWRAGDPQNLADVDGLGPWPVPLASTWARDDAEPVAYDDPALFAAWGDAVETTQSLEEATSFRAVMSGRWQFAGGEAGTRLAGHTWRYTVYPSGAVYVGLRSEAPETGWGPGAAGVGFALGLDGRRSLRLALPPEAGPFEDGLQYAVMAGEGPHQADILWTWPARHRMAHHRVYAAVDGRRQAIVIGQVPPDRVVESAHLLRVWPTDLDDAGVAGPIAGDYRAPASVALTSGRRIVDAPGDLDRDGYNESTGCYELSADGGALRGMLDPGPGLRFDPLLRVHGTAGRRCWVYARGQVVQTCGRDASDNLLVRLGRVVSAAMPVEIHVERSSENGNLDARTR